MFAEKGHAYAARILEKDGVELLLGTGVKAIGPGHVTLSDGSTIKTRCVIWGGGLDGSADRGRRRAPAGPRRPDRRPAGLHGCRIPRRPRHRRHREHPRQDGKTHPQLGSVALQSGSSAANTILADRAGKAAKPFSYLDKGTMAMIGRGAAVAQVRGVELHGKMAFAAWLGVHAALMTGGAIGSAPSRAGRRTSSARTGRRRRSTGAARPGWSGRKTRSTSRRPRPSDRIA